MSIFWLNDPTVLFQEIPDKLTFIDKLNLIFKETGKLNKRQDRDNTIDDIFKAIILDKKHLTEVKTPVDNKNLSVYQVERADADYNDP